MSDSYPEVALNQNMWERLSDQTNTVVTPANIVDGVAMVGAAVGIHNLDTWWGMVLAGASYGADVVDGTIARATNTASELGEKVDAAGDKVKLAFAIAKIYRMNAAPNWLLGGIVAVNSVNTVVTLADQYVNHDEPVVHPSKIGKRSMFMMQLGLGLRTIGSKLERDKQAPRTRTLLKATGTVLGGAGVVLGAGASVDYTHTFIQSRQQHT